MRINKDLIAGLALVVGPSLFAPTAQASLTHTGKVELRLHRLNASGKKTKVAAETAVLHIDWNRKVCDLRVGDLYAYCTVDVSQDLKTPRGELAVKAMPQIHFESGTVDAIVDLLENKRAMGEHLSGSNGLDLPFYECKDCEANGSGVSNVFGKGSPVTREFQFKQPLRKNEVLVMEFSLHSVSPVRGAFNVIGVVDEGRASDHVIRKKR